MNIALRHRIKAPKRTQTDRRNEVCDIWFESLQGLDTCNFQDTYRITKQLTNHFTTIPLLELNDKFAVMQQEKVNLFSSTKQDIS